MSVFCDHVDQSSEEQGELNLQVMSDSSYGSRAKVFLCMVIRAALCDKFIQLMKVD